MLKRANEDESQWNSLLEKYAETYPELAEELN
ncbi:Transketolase [Staphylococcus aureus]|uniref:Transketolase n=1 Tax=Staphylococcus aureus TaxID=1280 RepID=A0A380EJU0_STAAU|nr:Transketolase [Staphylococcus aureus]